MTASPVNHRDRLPSRRELREAGRRRPAGAQAESVHTPLPRFADATHTDETAPASRTPQTAPQRLLGALALVSVAGLTMSYSLPQLGAFGGASGEAEAVEAVAAQQGLFSEISIDELPVSLEEVEFVATDSNTKVSYAYDPDAVVNFPFTDPVLLTDGFGYRSYPVAQFHDAQDFAAPEGTPVTAIAEGTVLEAGFADDGCGFGLKLEHEIDGDTVTSRYCHMMFDSHSYEEGDEVEMGDPVGRIGNTGLSFGAHLHLSIRIDDEPTDPMPFLLQWSRVARAELADDATENAMRAPGKRAS